MGGGGQAEDDYAGAGVTKPRDGPSPVLFVSVGGPFLASDLFAPLDEARARAAGGYLPFELRERFAALPLVFRRRND